MKIYLENLNEEQLINIVTYNNDLREKLENYYIEGVMDYISDIINTLGGEIWDIGFYNRNYWNGKRSYEQLENIIKATEDFGLCSEEEIKKVEYCMELINRRECMDWNNKQIDNIENKIESLFDEIDDMVTNNFDNLTDDKYITTDLLLDELYNLLECEKETYYILDDLDTVYKDDLKEFC